MAVPGDPDLRRHVVHRGSAGPDLPLLFSPAANEAVEESDLCVALGTELGEPMHYGRTQHWAGNDATPQMGVLVEQDPTAIGVNRPIRRAAGRRSARCRAAAGRGAQGYSAQTRIRRLQTAGSKRTRKSLRSWPESAPSGRSPIHPARYVVEATKAFNELEDGIMVRDGGATVIFQWTYSQSKPRDVIWNQNFGHLGTGLPYAVGASVAEGGKRPVMLLTSDSAFLFHIAELETAARQKLPLVCVVGVDHQWGLEVGVYKRTFEQPSPQPGVHWSKDVRMDKIAEGFGCHGEYVEKEDEIGPAIAARLRQRQSRCSARVHRSEGQFRGDAQVRPIPHLVCRRHPVRKRIERCMPCANT